MTQEPTYLELLTASIIEARKMKSDIRSLIRGMESIFQDLVTVEVELCNLYARAADLGYATRTKFEAPYWVSQSFIAYPTPIPMPNWNKQK